MKKMFALAAILLACCAFRVAEVPLAESGEFTLHDGGRLAAVEVFAPTNGSVSLKQIWSAPVYTNVVSVVTNGAGTLSVGVWSNLTTHVVYTNWHNSLRGTSYRYPYAMATDTNLETTVTALADLATNVVPVVSEIVAVTNTLASGTASANVYSGAPATTNYLATGERLLFDGTATGGFLRLILE